MNKKNKANYKINHWMLATIILSIFILSIFTFQIIEAKDDTQLLNLGSFKITKGNFETIGNFLEKGGYYSAQVIDIENKQGGYVYNNLN